MFWAIMGVLIAVTITGLIIGEDRFNKWFDRKFRCPHDFEVGKRKNYLEPETEIAVCSKCGRKEIIEDGE